MADRKPIFIVEIPEAVHMNQEVRVNSIAQEFAKGIPKDEYHVMVLPTKNLVWQFHQFDDKNISQTEIDDIRRNIDAQFSKFAK